MKITKNYLKQVIKEELGRLEEAVTPIPGQIVLYSQAGKEKIGIAVGDGKIRPWDFAFTTQNYFLNLEEVKNVRSATKVDFEKYFRDESASERDAQEYHNTYGTGGD